MKFIRGGALAAMAVLLLAVPLRPDALVITKAMTAMTIAETFIDHVVIQKVTTQMLQKPGCQGDLAGNGQEAVEIGAKFPLRPPAHGLPSGRAKGCSGAAD